MIATEGDILIGYTYDGGQNEGIAYFPISAYPPAELEPGVVTPTPIVRY
jgi:hypothetical protein